MKSFIFMFTLFIAYQINAQETLKVNNELKSLEILKVVEQSVSDFLEFSSKDVSGGFDGFAVNPRITEITKDQSKVIKLKISSEAKILIVDGEFGDPVFEDTTSCETVLEKNQKDIYSLDLAVTTCDYEPKYEFEVEENENPCCEGSSPVVDSNMCFDSYEEGEQYCSQYSQQDYE